MPAQALDFGQALSAAAIARTAHTVRYDPSYRKIPYPNGDVPQDVGVCTDVIIRAYRALGIDLQKNLHEDLSAHFDAYPSHRQWGLTGADTNIDHRRVPNLQVYFQRHGQSLNLSRLPLAYQPGDLVTWSLPGNLPHIGIVTDRISEYSGNPLIVHNIGSGPQLEDMLFAYEITGHYRYRGSGVPPIASPD